MKTPLLTNKTEADDKNDAPIIVRGVMQVYVPTERDLFTLFLNKIDTLQQTIQANYQEITTLRQSLEEANKKLIEHSPKKFLTVKQLEQLYSISESQQKNLRNRINNPLSYHQDEIGGKIRYEVSSVEGWMSQQKVK